MANSKVKLIGVEGSRKWQKGESVTLIKNAAKGITGNPTLIEGKTTQGIKRYKYELALDADSITATITGAGLGDQAKSLSEGRAAGLGFLAGAADLLAGGGMESALTSAAGGAASGAYDTFGALGHAGTTLESGSHVDIKGTSLLVGASRNLKLDGSDWMIGMFVEGGKGTYDTYNTFDDAGEIHADGENKYWGVGLMARTTNKANVYTEGSLRVGRITTDYDSRDLETQYDSGAVYYGAHLGLGKIIKISERANLDLYGKYLWSQQNGDSVNIDGESFNFEALHSNRVRIGARINMTGNQGIVTYVGLAYEHEFSGKAGANSGGESVMEPSVKGGTGIGELGIQYKPKEDGAFSVNAGLNGYTGKREGIGGSFKFAWGF